MIPQQPFGRTGHNSTRILFGAAAFSRVTQKEADETLDVLLKYGINHIDTAASYGDSEIRLGPWMARHRQNFFLATKTGQRGYQAAKEEMHRSLERLKVDHVDLVQLHNLVDPREWDMAMGPGGALEAVIEARQQGLTRFIGVTGHGVTIAKMHLQSLEKFDFDSVLLPWNYPMRQNVEYVADFERLVALCQKRNVAVQTIKAITRAPWGEREHTHATWYEPLTEQADIDRAVHWVLDRPGLFLNTVGDIHLLPKVLDAANRFQTGPAETEMQTSAAQLEMAPLFV